MKSSLLFVQAMATVIGFATISEAQSPRNANTLAGTQELTETQPLDEVMVAGIDRFALRAIEEARDARAAKWHCDTSNRDAYERSLQPYREEFATLIGAVDPRVEPDGIQYIASDVQPAVVAHTDEFTVHAVRWPVLDGVVAEGLWLVPTKNCVARVVAIPEASWTPEMIAGIQAGAPAFAADLAAHGCEVLIPTVINREHQFSCNPEIQRSTNLPHREFLYRQAFELGRHVIGYEVQKVLAAVDQFERLNGDVSVPIAVAGVGEGGLLAFYAGALDPRVDATIVSGYFDQRARIWSEPIYRNVWRLLDKFGDAELARMVAPRLLYIETAPTIPREETTPVSTGRNIAAPGSIQPIEPSSARAEIARARESWPSFPQPEDAGSTATSKLLCTPPEQDGEAPLDAATVAEIVGKITGRARHSLPRDYQLDDARAPFDSAARQKRQLQQLVGFTQRLLRKCHRERDETFDALDRSSPQAWESELVQLRKKVHEELIGKIPPPTIDPRPRTRRILNESEYTGYEVVLDVYPDVIAAGILLLPTDLRKDEVRPVVVCQHGLEGTPMDTIGGPDTKGYRAYKGFAAELARRGFIVYAPQNPYRGGDAFRTLQRKSNPLGRSLFSYIIPQHLVTLRWLSTLPNVDPQRIGFYGLSYGGKTAMRVPPLLSPTKREPGYCLSICSADFNEWVAKNASVDAPFSYLWTGEYEIFEWNMGHVANYGELGMMMAPRPFMVERGHDDGVGLDEWVAWEYAKVRRHYNKLGLGDRTEIEFFDGPHTINGQATYDFLHRHLDWPK